MGGNMFWFTSFVTLLASIGLVLAMPGGDKHIITSCATQSTCKAVYSTYSKEKDVPVTKVITTTVYKPETKTTTVHQLYTTTVYNTVTATTNKVITQRQNMSRARRIRRSATPSQSGSGRPKSTCGPRLAKCLPPILPRRRTRRLLPRQNIPRPRKCGRSPLVRNVILRRLSVRP